MNPYSQIPTHNLDYLVYTRREPIAVVFAATGQTSSRTTVDCGPTPVRVFGPGIGRKNGVEAMDAYLHTRSVWVELAGPTRDPFTLG